MQDTTHKTEQWEVFSKQFTQYLNRPGMQSCIKKLLDTGETRMTINIDHLRQIYPQLVDLLLSHPIPSLKILENVLQVSKEDLIKEGLLGESYANTANKISSFRFAFEGTFEKNKVMPSELNASKLNKLVCVDGIVTKISIVKPKLIKSAHYCELTKTGYLKEYHDHFNLLVDEKLQNKPNIFPIYDLKYNPLTTEYGLCKYKDYQILTLQDMPEQTSFGLVSQSVEVIMEEDLVNKAKPGDRVQVVGVYKVDLESNSNSKGLFKGILIATNIKILSSGAVNTSLTPEDVRNIRKIAERPDLYELLSRSIAPSVYGHENIKKGILLALLGGIEKTLETKTNLRGNINILIIGDPSTAKSQFLRKVLSIAPLAISTTGKGSSSAGLTAVVAVDKNTGERHLEAGAMVLADKGIVCIDEFDKMEEKDRAALHEIMEQQTVTIAKAGIHATLNARCSIIAAANPTYGEYQKELSFARNIGFSDSLLSRFDLIFTVSDNKDSEVDRKIAEKVIMNHRHIDSGVEEIVDTECFHNQDKHLIDQSSNQTFQENDSMIYNDTHNEILSLQFLRKYIFLAKTIMNPQIKDEGINFISKAWAELRQQSTKRKNVNNLCISVRTLETLIRLSTAHAKMRFSQHVEISDCEEAFELLWCTLFNESVSREILSNAKNEDQNDLLGSADFLFEMNRKQKKEERLNYKRKFCEEVKEESYELLTKKVKKVIMDQDEGDNDEEIVKEDIKAQEEAMKYVFKKFHGLLKGRRHITEAELWSEIKKHIEEEDKSLRRILAKREGMNRILRILDNRNKLMVDTEKKIIISL